MEDKQRAGWHLPLLNRNADGQLLEGACTAWAANAIETARG
jgi:hypothetical protein